MKKDLIDIRDLSQEEIDDLIATAEDIIAHPEAYHEKCKYKKLATLFYEPSTRTRLSFEAAMYELGGNVHRLLRRQRQLRLQGRERRRHGPDGLLLLPISSPCGIRRRARPLSPRKTSAIPVINAGDGGHNHPTQTLTDLLTIRREKGHLDNLTIGCCGDLKFGRTVHSLISAMSRYPGVRFILISPEELRIPEHVRSEILDKNGIDYVETTSLEEAMPQLDILYMTRVQRERFFNEADYIRLKDSYILTPDKLKTAKQDLAILHPLPRVNEISVAVDKDPRACYFKQVLCGKYIRMALILKLLGVA